VAENILRILDHK